MSLRFGGARSATTARVGHSGGRRLGTRTARRSSTGDDCPSGAGRRPTALFVNSEVSWQRRPVLGVAAAIFLMKGTSEDFEHAGYILGESVLAQLGIGLGDRCGRGSCVSVVGGFRTLDYPRVAWTSSEGSADDPGT